MSPWLFNLNWCGAELASQLIRSGDEENVSSCSQLSQVGRASAGRYGPSKSVGFSTDIPPSVPSISPFA